MLFVGIDWSEEYHDVEIQDEAGRKLAARRLPEGAAGIARLHELIAAYLDADGDPGQVVVGIETDRRLWVQALAAAGYQVYGLNPKQVARFKERYDAADAHALADMVRAERHQLRAVAADIAGGQAIKVAARAHQTRIWERTRHTLRLRSALREFFPAALVAYADLGLTGTDTLELLTRARPAAAAKLTTAQISAALKRARRRDVPARAQAIKDALRAPQLAQPAAITAAYAAAMQAAAAVLITLNEQISRLRTSWRPIFCSTRTLRSTCPSPASGPSTAPGCSPSSGTPRTATPPPRPARTTPGPAPSPARPAAAKSSWPATSAMTGSPTPCTPRPSPH